MKGARVTVDEPIVPTLGDRLHDLWSDERCVVDLNYDGSAGTSWPWLVGLVWTSEYDNPHHADWATYTWQFYGETPDDALVQAVRWAEGLLPFKQCGACDGRGRWKSDEPCDECGGSGLEHGGDEVTAE